MWTAIGTAIGGVAGWILGVALRATVHGPSPLFGDEVNSGIWGAIGGFAVAVTMLRRRASTENNSAMELQPPPS